MALNLSGKTLSKSTKNILKPKVERVDGLFRGNNLSLLCYLAQYRHCGKIVENAFILST